MKEFNSFADFRFNMHLIPDEVAFDIIVRITDWIVSGGTLDDEYVKRQLNYASQFINRGI